MLIFIMFLVCKISKQFIYLFNNQDNKWIGIGIGIGIFYFVFFCFAFDFIFLFVLLIQYFFKLFYTF